MATWIEKWHFRVRTNLFLFFFILDKCRVHVARQPELVPVSRKTGRLSLGQNLDETPKQAAAKFKLLKWGF